METKRKNSRKRQAMLDLLLSSREHPTAEMLYNLLKPDYPELSLGTVYRNLSVLAEDGMVISVGTVGGQERYDANTAPHPHFVCRNCLRVIDLELPDTVSGMYNSVEHDYNCSCEGYSLSLSGLCDCCHN